MSSLKITKRYIYFGGVLFCMVNSVPLFVVGLSKDEPANEILSSKFGAALEKVQQVQLKPKILRDQEHTMKQLPLLKLLTILWFTLNQVGIF